MDDVIKAAGGVVTRSENGELEVLLVHRKRYDPNEWTLPKGKLTGSETHEQAAVREVFEETGRKVKSGPYLGALAYAVEGRPKVIRFWRMMVVAEGSPRDRDEVLQAVWLPLPEALRRMSHAGEREFLRSVLDPKVTLTDLAPERTHYWYGFEWVYWLLGIERSRSRLLRTYESSCTELQFLAARQSTRPRTWIAPATTLLAAVRLHLTEQDFEAGWHCLHAANRFLINGLEPDEVKSRAAILREEAAKKYAAGWRGGAILQLLGKTPQTPEVSAGSTPVTHEQLIEATMLRDDADETGYHKVALMADQLGLLLFLAVVSTIVILCLMLLPQPCAPTAACELDWSPSFLALILGFGVLGASFSAAQTILGNTADMRIPERVANKWVTFVRALMGGVAAFAGHVLLHSNVVQMKIGDDSFGARLAIAFIFGYAGEKLISRLVGSFEGK